MFRRVSHGGEKDGKSSDYERIAAAIRFIVDNATEQVSLEEVAEHVGLSPFHFQRLFRRWAGVTPKRFLQVLTVERAKSLLAGSESMLGTAHQVGLSGGARLHDHFVQLEAVTPGEFRSEGEGLEIEYGSHRTPFGEAFIARTPRGICELSFGEDRERALDSLKGKWLRASFEENEAQTATLIERIFSRSSEGEPLRVHVRGTNFQVQVWKALLQIARGAVTSYGQIAETVGAPGASRAVGTAVGANPVAFLIPCHRVIRASGELGGFRWGLVRKQAIHAWESLESSD